MPDPITGVGAETVAATDVAYDSGASEATGALGQLDSDAFLQLLVAQLRYQNPLEPASGTEFLNQTAQFAMVEALQKISEAQQRHLGMEEVGMALDVVDKVVTAIGYDGSEITGVVDAVRFVADGPVLTVAGVEVPLANVVTVEPAGAAGEEAAADEGVPADPPPEVVG